MARFVAGLLIIAVATGLLSLRVADRIRTVTWKLDNLEQIGGQKPVILGNPRIMREQSLKAIYFDGMDDGIVLPVNPVKNQEKFTVEVLFKPLADGPAAPRFLHFEDKLGNRGTIEARITPEGNWYLDTFLKNGKTGQGLTLIDATRQHPCDQWYWVALVYDGHTMRHYINGRKELEDTISFKATENGRISLGVRLNKVNWFKGLISEVRFHQSALPGEALQHP